MRIYCSSCTCSLIGNETSTYRGFDPFFFFFLFPFFRDGISPKKRTMAPTYGHFPAVMPYIMVAMRHLFVSFMLILVGFCAKERTMAAGYLCQFPTVIPGNGSYAPPFLCDTCLFWSVLRKRANYGSMLCIFPTVTPDDGRHAPRLFGPFILRFVQQIMAIASPAK